MSIFKSKKRILSIVLAVVMVAALFLCGSVMAAGGNDRSTSVSVTVTVQSKDSSGVVTWTQTVNNYSVTVTGTSVTVYDVVEALAADTNYTCAKDAVWKTVQSGSGYAKALVSLSNSSTNAYGAVTTNVWGSHSTMTVYANNGTYNGSDWYYYLNGISSYNYMDQQTVSNNDTIVLSYEDSAFSW